MRRGRIVAAIDIGTSKITTIIASASEEMKKVNVIGVASVKSRGLRKSQIVDLEEATEAIVESVEAAERMAGYSLSSAFVSVGGSHIESLNSKGVVAVSEPEGEIISADIDRVVEAARAVSLPTASEIIHVIPRDFVVDSQGGIKDPIGMSGVRLESEVHLIIGSSTAIRNLVKCLNEIGVQVESLVFSGLAAAEAVLTETEKELGVTLVDIGAGTLSIAVFVEGALSYSSVIPIGAANITNDIAIGLRVSLSSAEKIKVALSKGNTKKEEELDLRKLGIREETKKVSCKTLIEGIIRPRLNEIFKMVGEELKKTGFAAKTPAGVVLTGGGSQTVIIKDACRRILSLPSRIGKPRGLSGLIEEIKTPEFAVSYGLILYGLRNVPAAPFSPLKSFKNVVRNLPVRGALKKLIDLVKSFLP